MCTGFVRKGRDLVLGYNLDLALGAWDYRVYARRDKFYIGIRVGGTVYKTHGIRRDGGFGCLPYMNDASKGVYRRGRNVQRVDLLVDGYLSGKYSYPEALALAREKEIVNVPNASMHALLTDAAGHVLLVEPGLGCRELDGSFAVISNFPLLEEVADLTPPWYGKERYDRGTALLQSSGDDFSARDGLELLRETRQEGEWATRVSFVYTRRENAVYYVLDNDFTQVKKHVLI